MAYTPRLGLVLSGGGARGAYQAGVLLAICETLEKSYPGFPFPVLTGVSAGAINACYLAAHAHDYVEGARKLCDIWRNLTAEQVFKTDSLSLGRIGMRWLFDVSSGSLQEKKIKALLDTAPLRELINQTPFELIQKNLDERRFESLAITALDYSTAFGITFVQAQEHVKMWDRLRRKGIRAQINADHVMASSAIPLFFPPIAVDGHFYGDGCLRNTAPLSPAVHLEANKLLIVGVKKAVESTFEKKVRNTLGEEVTPPLRPTIARILSVILNGVFLDAIDLDVERLNRVNKTLAHIPAQNLETMDYQPIEFCWIRPSEDLGKLAVQYTDHLPKMIRFLMSGLGSAEESGDLTSYLLFDPDFCSHLVELGYSDGMNQQEEILQLILPKPDQQKRSI